MNNFLKKCRLANSFEIPALKYLFETCFSASPAEVTFFFEKKFDLNNCLVYKADGKVVSALHLMDAELVHSCCSEKAYYVYAASTLPDYIKCGFMSALINYSFVIAKNRGKTFSVLKPEDLELYKFYEKLGYRKFFKESFFILNKRELFSLLKEKHHFEFTEENDFNKKTSMIYDLLKRMCAKSGGICWSEDHINYALEYNKLCGGKAFVFEEGFLVCGLKNEHTLEISELFCLTKNTLFRLLFNLLYTFKNVKEYIFKVPVGCFKGILKEKVQYCGMIRGLKEGVKILDDGKPYIGFTL